MKNFLLLFCVLAFTSCQTPKSLPLKANLFSSRENVNNEWTKFTNWDTIDVNIDIQKSKFVFKKSTIIIYGDPKMTFKVIGKPKETTTENKEEVLVFNCKDNDGYKCNIILIDQGKSIKLIVYYKNLNLCYNVIER